MESSQSPGKRAVVITPIVILCIGVFAILLYRRRRRQKREEKAGVRRVLNPDTGNYELRPLAPLERVRLARPVVRRVESGGSLPPDYGEAVAGMDGGRVLGWGDGGCGEGVGGEGGSDPLRELARRQEVVR